MFHYMSKLKNTTQIPIKGSRVRVSHIIVVWTFFSYYLTHWVASSEKNDRQES